MNAVAVQSEEPVEMTMEFTRAVGGIISARAQPQDAKSGKEGEGEKESEKEKEKEKDDTNENTADLGRRPLTVSNCGATTSRDRSTDHMFDHADQYT
jgi:hypothetical protein